jgi:probable HAF family extracellular repeat protein
MEPLEDRQLLSYTITNLGSLGGTISVPLEVNNRGEVVGGSFTANNAAEHAFLYRHGRMTDLSTLGGKHSIATGINARGTIIGLSQIAPGSAQVDIFLERGGKLTDLGPLNPAAVMAGPVAINDKGVIAGLSPDNGEAWVVRRGIKVDLGSLAGLGSVVRDLNNRGEVVGFSLTSFLPDPSGSGHPTSTFHAFLYRHGKISDLGTLGGPDSEANFINDRGVVVGSSFTVNSPEPHAFLYCHGRMRDLGTLGGSFSVAAAINDQGAVVGASSTSTSALHGFIDRHGQMGDLNNLIPADSGFVITNARDINDRGQIAAEGYETSSPQTHVALLLNPRPSAK